MRAVTKLIWRCVSERLLEHMPNSKPSCPNVVCSAVSRCAVEAAGGERTRRKKNPKKRTVQIAHVDRSCAVGANAQTLGAHFARLQRLDDGR